MNIISQKINNDVQSYLDNSIHNDLSCLKFDYIGLAFSSNINYMLPEVQVYFNQQVKIYVKSINDNSELLNSISNKMNQLSIVKESVSLNELHSLSVEYKNSFSIKKLDDLFNTGNLNTLKNIVSSNIGSQSLTYDEDLCALDLIDQLLSKHIENQTIKAEEAANEISYMADTIAQINHLWGQVMSLCLPHVDPNSNDIGVDIWYYAGDLLNQIDSLIKSLDDGGGVRGEILMNMTHPNYSELQQMNANMVSYCDKKQVDLDSMQQDFENLMTEITSAQEELVNLRQAVVALAKR
ncbi:hypothetical protein [Vibrio coralliilyticus]|uniref:hypothetical protein n=1 Tax=Vibrio coralliilyticus TaxID=190893 RepID=UPI0017CC076A|nr:hypothetical protein [Vibrio coralliilyticus]NUW68058.1 hypothetical protein [Vibrio coralliilyticus]